MTAPFPVTPEQEEALYGGRTHPKVLLPAALVQAVILVLHVAAWRYLPDSYGNATVDRWADLAVHLVLLLVEITYAVVPFLKWYHSWFEITDRRVSMRWGVLYKNSREIALDRITQVNEERGIIDRLFRAGTIVIHDAANASAIRFHDVPRFRAVRRTLDEARSGAQHRGQQATVGWPGQQFAQAPPGWPQPEPTRPILGWPSAGDGT